jgi:hypothetical protein
MTTRNVKDFAGLGIAILNPWESEPWAVMYGSGWFHIDD